MVPEARVAVAHGQMDEGTLEQVVLDFWEGRYDVLVCTTIIESGIDMPTVNTLVVDRADLLGLGQLHQLRGRVGRAGMRAYAYLFHPADRVLSETAYERLRTIGDHTELGSGFKIALRDLQIRGAGNLLGPRPVGPHRRHRLRPLRPDGVRGGVRAEGRAPAPAGRAVGRPARRRPPARRTTWRPRTCASRPTAAWPRCGPMSEVEDVRAEWEDRFGPLPAPAAALLEVALLRVECLRLGVDDLAVSVPRFASEGRDRGGGPGGRAVAKLTPITLPASAEVRLRRLAPGGTYQAEAPAGSPCRSPPDPAPAGTRRCWCRLLRELVPAG